MIELKLNQPMMGYESGRKITVESDCNGVPLDKFWRRRLKDAKTDNCCEVVKPPKTKKARLSDQAK